MEHSYIMIKPEGVKRRLVGELIKRFETKGYKLTAMKMVKPTMEILREHYAEHVNKPFFPGLAKHFTSGSVICMIWSGKNCVAGCRKIIGATNPFNAECGSIRSDFCNDTGRNIIHGSDSVESAKREISIWFKEGFDYEDAYDQDLIYDLNE
ncbi:Nucleoside diphosphate kinase [Astathelohania contejeani]|uniref:Nucleoside diphosphate kinase n=1 Tax=Astathelohania contejeani TaxID=164912 RepID=A0ABQ7I152_9MICR|nr:Nucleoside diphosphate kinase [Thelohania contejeani]